MAARQIAQQLIGRYIRQLREQKGMTLEELASEAGISYQYLSGIETGKENFTISVFEAVANALQFPVRTIVSLAYEATDAIEVPKANPAYFRANVPLPEGLEIEHIEAAMNQAQAMFHRINCNLMIEVGKPIQAFIQSNNFSGLVSNIFADALNDQSPYKHNHHQKYPDLVNQSANDGEGEGLEVKATINVTKGGESHNGHSGWHTIVCYEINEKWDIDFTLIMFANLNGHQTAEPDWEYVKSTVNVETGSQRTETYITNLFGKTKLRDGSVYLDPTKVNYRRWRQARRGNEPIPPWSIFS
jgi:transcriptional regulator with XRE-family HTH domain